MYCECGCGRITTKSKRTDRRAKILKGQYRRFIQGHGLLKPSPRYRGIDILVSENQNKNICSCGCGQAIPIAAHHFYSGKSIPKYIHGHHSRVEKYKAVYRKNNKKRVGALSPRWKVDREQIRGRRRCKVDFTRRQKKDIYIRDKGICSKCGVFCLRDVDNAHPFKANIDHVVPVQSGGVNEMSNGQVLCLSCHKIKHSAVAKRMNSGKPRTGNPEPSAQSAKVQRLPEHSDMLNNRLRASAAKAKR